MRKLFSLVVLLIVLGCGSGSDDKAKTAQDSGNTATTESVESEPVEAVTVATATRSVACGCSIKGVGACGDYVEIDGSFVEIANWEELGLGAMEWCGQEGVLAQTAGELRDGKFYATTVAVVSD